MKKGAVAQGCGEASPCLPAQGLLKSDQGRGRLWLSKLPEDKGQADVFGEEGAGTSLVSMLTAFMTWEQVTRAWEAGG